MKHLASFLVAVVALPLLLCAASACDAPPSPIVGVVNTRIEGSGDRALLTLSDVYTFQEALGSMDSIDANLDGYADIVKAYLAKNLTLLEKYKWWRVDAGGFSYSVKLLKTISIQKGDIIVNGPPEGFRDCASYVFSAVFSPDGMLRYAITEPVFVSERFS